MSKTWLLLVMTALLLLLGCSEEKLKDVSEYPEIRPFVGGQYEIVGLVYAYGIRRHSKAPIDLITLIPPPGIEGSEVGFKVPLQLGSRITVLKVLETNRVFDPNMDLVVKVDGNQLPMEAIARIELFRGNQGDGYLELNPAIYRKVAPS